LKNHKKLIVMLLLVTMSILGFAAVASATYYPSKPCPNCQTSGDFSYINDDNGWVIYSCPSCGHEWMEGVER